MKEGFREIYRRKRLKDRFRGSYSRMRLIEGFRRTKEVRYLKERLECLERAVDCQLPPDSLTFF
jgi:hypothetical protein